MTAFYKNHGYEDDPDYPDSSNSRINLGSQNSPNYPFSRKKFDNPKSQYNANYSSTHNYPDYSGALSMPDYPEDYLDNPGFRNLKQYPGPHQNPAFLRSQRTPDYTGLGNNFHHSKTKYNSHPQDFLVAPDYPGAEDYEDSRGGPDYPGAWNNAYRSSSKNYLDQQGSRGTPNYMGAKDYIGSRNNPDSSNTRNNQSYLDSMGIPDYPGAEDRLDSLDNWRSVYYRGIQNDHNHSYPENLEMRRRTLGSDGKGNQNYPESFQMAERQPASLYSKNLVPDPDGNRYINSIGRRRNWRDSSLQSFDPTFVSVAEKIRHEEKLVASLVELTSRDRNKIIRNQPMTIQEKRKIKKKVSLKKQRTSSHSVHLNCCAQCLNTTSLHFRRFKNILSEFFQSLQVWQRTLKVIGGKFGTSVLSYFSFLTWLLKFNVFSFIVNFSFITIPQLTESRPNNLPFTGLELLTGTGYFQQTVMYYGFYTNSTIKHNPGISSSYNMQLAYIFTIGLYLVVCFFCLLYSMACSFRNNFINPHIYSRGTAKLVFSWDFTITQEKAVKLKQRNLTTELKENLAEIRHENVIAPLKKRMYHLGTHLMAWVVSTGVAIASCTAVYYLSFHNLKFLSDHKSQAATLLLPFVVSCINLFVPLFYSSFGMVEKFEISRHQVFVIVTRNIFLKISIIGILCYYWLNLVAVSSEECWETLVGQDIYRLLMMNFLFTLFDSFCGEFLRRIIGTKFIKSLGVPEFDIATNVLELIYAQTLLWIGIFFSPLMPFIHMITLFITFYVKKISLMMNCQPPSKAWRASQMMTLFIFLLFFPSFTGVLCVLAITVWRLKPSAACGPFQGLPSIIHAIYGWIEILSNKPGYLWVVWIYRNLIGSVHFFFILTLIVLIITYLYWQIIEGRKIMIKLLHEQIINEGKDKMFLLEKLLKLQEAQKKSSPFSLSLERRDHEMESGIGLNDSIELPSRSGSSLRRDPGLSLQRAATDLTERSRLSLWNQNSEIIHDHEFHHVPHVNFKKPELMGLRDKEIQDNMVD